MFTKSAEAKMQDFRAFCFIYLSFVIGKSYEKHRADEQNYCYESENEHRYKRDFPTFIRAVGTVIKNSRYYFRSEARSNRCNGVYSRRIDTRVNFRPHS